MKVSVEYAHIYTNQQTSLEHELSLQHLGKTVTSIKRDGNEVSLVVMVDDYSFPDPTFDYASFAQWLADQGYKPDLMIRESQLIPVCDQLLDLIQDQRTKGQLVDYIKAKKKYPCSLFIAAWYLLRLGKIESDILPTEFQSVALINILPESFQPFEEKGIEIIKAAGFEQVVADIHYTFLPGRLVV